MIETWSDVVLDKSCGEQASVLMWYGCEMHCLSSKRTKISSPEHRVQLHRSHLRKEL